MGLSGLVVRSLGGFNTNLLVTRGLYVAEDVEFSLPIGRYSTVLSFDSIVIIRDASYDSIELISVAGLAGCEILLNVEYNQTSVIKTTEVNSDTEIVKYGVV
jgi:hypothetical protein